MKRAASLVGIIAVILALFPGWVLAATQSDPFITDLIAGQNTDVGDIKIWNDANFLYVQFETVDPYCLKETHLHVGDDLSDIPQVNGNPAPGQFEFKNKHDCVTEFLYKVPLEWSACELIIAAHAAINTGETAWGFGPAFPGKNWATYIVYPVEGCGGPPSETPTGTSTVTPTATSTSTNTATPTDTPTSTPTGTVTNTPTNTPTHTATATATDTATPTATFTPTPTSTFTPTPTGTPCSCTPETIWADFSKLAAGDTVEGMGKVAPNLDIQAKGLAVKIEAGKSPTVSTAPNDKKLGNEGVAAGGGFSDNQTQDAWQPHRYTFTFAPGKTVTDFTLHMLDFGDLNPDEVTHHRLLMTALDANGSPVATDSLEYDSEGKIVPRQSDHGDLWYSGDAVFAAHGQPGDFTWEVSGSGIQQVVLEFPEGFDPNIAFDELGFTTECECNACTGRVSADFSQVVNAGDSVQGMDKVAPYLDIQAKTGGLAVKIEYNKLPTVFTAPNDKALGNYGIGRGGGFSDNLTQNSWQPHEYTFTFATGQSASDFTLHMVDYGDLNPDLSTQHRAVLIALNASGKEIARQELNFESEDKIVPRTSDYGDLWYSGDAVYAADGQPGDFTWHLRAGGIHQVLLQFPVGFDPNIGFDMLAFTLETCGN